MPVQECRRKTTSTEFVKWRIRMEREVNEFHREDAFLAMIAMMIAKANSKEGDNITMEPFMLKFTTSQKEEESLDLKKNKAKASMSAWAAFIGGEVGEKIQKGAEQL